MASVHLPLFAQFSFCLLGHIGSRFHSSNCPRLHVEHAQTVAASESPGRPYENPARSGKEDTNRPNAKDFAVNILNINLTLTPQLVELLNASIAINSTTFEDVDSESGAMVFIGNKTETHQNSQRLSVGIR